MKIDAMKKFNLVLLGLMLVFGKAVYAEDLLAIYQQALEADPELKSSETKIKIGTAQKGQALGSMLPQVTGTANWSINSQRQDKKINPVSDYYGVRYIVSLSQTLLDFPKFWTWRRTKATESQYTLENIEAQHALLFKVVEKYFDVLETEDELDFYKSEEEITEQQLEQIQKLFDR